MSPQIKHADHPTAPPSKGKSHDVYYVYTASFHRYVYIFIHIIGTDRSGLANGNESYSAEKLIHEHHTLVSALREGSSCREDGG